ncbi:hypothetical protein, partial [Citrobacter freundii]|uniref:hypothetical protein n=1 Tax=Citrobacter freundii TaxID=546 RepID=UPI003AAEE568
RLGCQKACVLPENPASYRVVRTKSYLFNKAALSEERTFTSLFQWPNLVHHYTPKHMSSNKLAVSAVC